MKSLIPNPWPGAAKRFEKGGVYKGVTGVTRCGVFVSLEPGVNALCKHLRTDRFRVEKGDVVAVAVKDVALKGDGGQINGSVARVIRKRQLKAFSYPPVFLLGKILP